MADILKLASPYWVNMFDNPPVDFDDTEEYEYVEYLEAQAGGSAPDVNQSIFRLYNRDIDPYLYFHKGVIQIRGYIATDANIGTYFNGSVNTGEISLCNLGQYAIFSKAELRLENTLIQKLDNPRHIAQVKSLVRFCDDNVRSQGTLTFFYKDTGTGDADNEKYNTVPYLDVNIDIDKVQGDLADQTVDDPPAQANIQTVVDNIVVRLNAQQYRIPGDTAFGTNESNTYNQGFADRHKRCIAQSGATKKVFEMYLPLAYLFDFYDSNRFPFRGLKHEILLYKESNKANFLHRNDATVNGQFVFDKISLWVPRMKPSLERMADLDAKFAEGAMTTLRWTDYDWFISPTVPAANRNYNWRVTASQGRPSKAYVFYQLAATVNGNQTTNKMIFNNLTNEGAGGINTVEMRINSHVFPRETLTLNFTDDQEDYLRAYLMLLESQGKMLAEDTGLMISYEEFKTLYTLFVFDFTKIERRIYENISSAEVEVRWTLRDSAEGDYICFCILESEKQATMRAVDQKLLISL